MFNRPTLAQIQARIKSDIESRLQTGKLLPSSILAVLGNAEAGSVHLLYGYMDWLSRQLFPDTAEDELLDQWAGVWKVTRKPATRADGNVTFTGINASVVPSGTQILRSDGVEFRTTASGIVASGTVTVAAEAVLLGAQGDTEVAIVLSLVNPVAGVDGTATVASGGLTGGENQESDDSLRARLLTRIQEPPHGGAAQDYIAWALAVPGVTRAWVYPNHLGVGTVGVTFVSDNPPASPIPDGALVTDVQNYIDERRPVTADVTVYPPVANVVDFNIQLAPNTAEVQAAVRAELEDLITRTAEPGGTLLISQIREAVSIASGEGDNVVVSPSADVVSPANELAILGSIIFGAIP